MERLSYTDFRDMFKSLLSGNQLANLQDTAFTMYADENGYLPARKEQKQKAYGRIKHLFDVMEMEDYIEFLGLYRIPEYKAIKFYETIKN